MSVSQTKYVWGVKVYLAQAVTEDTDIGMYVENFGAADTQIDISKVGDVVSYHWDSTGTAPGFISNGMNIGDAVVINAASFNAANNGTFYVTAIFETAFSVTNAAGIAENNKLLGSTTAIKSAHQMRWIQNTVTTTKTWKQGVLVDKAIAPIEQTADFTIGGNIAQVKGTSVTIKNIDGTNPLWDTLRDAGVQLIGKRVQIIEFDHSASPATETVLGTFIFDGAPKWNEGTFTLEAVPAYYKRNVLVGALVDNQLGGNYPNADAGDVGKLIPITVGEIRPDGTIDGYAKAIRISNAGTRWISANSPGYVDAFPVVDIYPIISPITPLLPSRYSFKAIRSYSAYTALTIETELVGKYVYVVIDTNEKGVYRKILTASCTGSDIDITIDQPFRNMLSTSSYIQIVDIDVSYNIDTFTNGGPVNEDGSAIINKPVIFVHDNEYLKLPESFFGVTVGAGNTNIAIDPLRSYVDVGTIKDTTSRPVLSICKYEYAYFASTSGQTLYKSKSGYYTTSTYIGSQVVNTDTGEATLAIDRDNNTCSEYQITLPNEIPASGLSEHAFIYRIQPAEIMAKDGFTKTYLGLNASMAISATAISTTMIPYMDIYTEDWAGNIVLLKTIRMIGAGSPLDFTNTINNIPIWHCTTNPPSSNEKYDTQIGSPGPYVADVSGYQLIEITRSGESINKDNYELLSYIYLVLRFTTPSVAIDSFVHNVKIYEASFLFYNENTVGDAVYSPWRGRIYNDYWATGRTGREKVIADMIVGVPDIMEHFLRLQNWNDRDRNIAWGSAYAPNALINTGTGIGGFDNAELDPLRAAPLGTIKAARQILNEGDATTGNIVQSLCKEFDLCSYQDNIGQECVGSITRSSVTPDISLSLNDIIPGSISDIEEMGAADVFCEPYVRYAYNSATDKYDGIMRVTHSSADTFNAAYVSGYSGGDAELIWNMAHALYLRYGIITEPPAEITELKWVRDKEDAKDRLLARLKMMGVYTTDGSTAIAASRKRFSFAVPYATATTIGATHTPWFVSQHIDILLPHQTAGVSVQCVIEGIRFDLYAGTADVTVICYDITSELQYFVKDTYGASSPGVDDWKDTYSTQAEAPTNGNDIKDTY